MKSDAQKIAGPADLRLKREIEKAEFIAILRRALDLRYRRLCQAARTDWERLIGNDQSDTCVTVRVQTSPRGRARGSGFLKSRRDPVSKPQVNGSVPRFAQ